jgi:hypothetical protein
LRLWCSETWCGFPTFRQGVCLAETTIVKRKDEPVGVHHSLNGTVVGRGETTKGLPVGRPFVAQETLD